MNNLIYTRMNNEINRRLKNELRDKIIDNNSNVVVSYTYDSYGNIMNIIGNSIYNPMIYKGYYYDNDIGMYYLKSRFYNPSFRRFFTPDSVSCIDKSSSVGSNLYAYCNNNPVMFTDRTGHFAISIAIGLSILGGVLLLSLRGDSKSNQYQSSIISDDLDINALMIASGGSFAIAFSAAMAASCGSPVLPLH